jgi:tRNA threonylcarbamoyl adenosine modification protein YeaZ
VLTLALDTSTPAITVAVLDGVVALAEATTEVGNQHGEALAPAISALLDHAGVRPDDLSAVAVGLGPGPFTGLRVGIMTAAALADALAIPAYGACSLDLFGAQDCLVVTDARRREVYWAAYDTDCQRMDGPHVSRPADVPLEGRPVIGPATQLYPQFLPGRPAWPSATTLGRLVAGRVRDRHPGDALTPIYLRRPDAVPPGPPKRVSA